MNFRFTPKHGRQDPGKEDITFTIDRLWAEHPDGAIEITHLLDRTYGYHSARELQWHLADRFALPKHDVRLDRL